MGIPDLRGGLRFVGVDGNGIRQKQTNQNNWGPRFGFAYQINARTVIRGGYGLFFLPNTGDGAGPANANEGFTAVTQFVSSLDGGITPADRLSNPFPQFLHGGACSKKISHPGWTRMADVRREKSQAFFGSAFLAPKKWFTAMRRLT